MDGLAALFNRDSRRKQGCREQGGEHDAKKRASLRHPSCLVSRHACTSSISNRLRDVHFFCSVRRLFIKLRPKSSQLDSRASTAAAREARPTGVPAPAQCIVTRCPDRRESGSNPHEREVISDFGPAGGPEPGVLSNRSSLVAQRLLMCTLRMVYPLGNCAQRPRSPGVGQITGWGPRLRSRDVAASARPARWSERIATDIAG